MRFSSTTLIAGGAVLASTGYATAAMAPSPSLALLGFVVIGLGLAPIVPVAFRVAGRRSPHAPGVGVAAVSTLGYVGFLAGPAVIGLIADWTSLRVSLGLVAVVLLVVAGLAFRLARPAAARAAVSAD